MTARMMVVKPSLTAAFVCVRPAEKVAELSYVATLEDLGLVKAREVIVSDSSQVRWWYEIRQTGCSGQVRGSFSETGRLRA